MMILPFYRDYATYKVYLEVSGLSRRSLAYDNSRFCIFKFTKPADEHHLQVFPALTSLVFVHLPGLLKLRHLTAKKILNFM
jgi:hypothetical protein